MPDSNPDHRAVSANPTSASAPLIVREINPATIESSTTKLGLLFCTIGSKFWPETHWPEKIPISWQVGIINSNKFVHFWTRQSSSRIFQLYFCMGAKNVWVHSIQGIVKSNVEKTWYEVPKVLSWLVCLSIVLETKMPQFESHRQLFFLPSYPI